MPDYSKSKIYKVVCDETNLTYYGSTVQKLCQRLTRHRNKNNKCITRLMKNPKIYLVENFQCNNREELSKRERWYIENKECCNKNIPSRTNEEWYEENKERIKEQSKKYREKNKEQIKEYNKAYRTANRDILNAKRKEYYQAKKDIDKM